jgi:hypothetical protein
VFASHTGCSSEGGRLVDIAVYFLQISKGQDLGELNALNEGTMRTMLLKGSFIVRGKFLRCAI